MNRIICDICGSEYPETADRCPICSYARQGNEKVVAASTAETPLTKVKGGRFSAKNVKKRRKAQRKAAAAEPVREKERDPNRPLWVVIILLLIAIVLVSVYIGMRFFHGRGALTALLPQATTTQPSESTAPAVVPCAAINLDNAVIALDEPGQEHRIVVKLMPSGTTDTVTFTSSDPAVAAVSEDGLLTATGSGEATITITCGDIVRECSVVCWFPEETTAPPETTLPPETVAPTEAPKPTQAPEPPKAPEPTKAPELTLDQGDVSFFAENESFTLYVKLGDKSVSRSEVTWSSSDPSVATVENGLVTGVGKGTATITAEYEGKKASCIVRCRFQDTSWKASASDVTLSVGESFRLTVTNNSGETADAIWTMDIDGVVSIDGKAITGRAPGTVTLTATVDGVTVTCIVRVK